MGCGRDRPRRSVRGVSTPPGRDFTLAWAVVSSVQIGQTTAVVNFDLFGAPNLDASSGTNLKLARVGTLNPGDKILVARTGGGGWVILDRIQVADDLEA